MYMCMYMYMWMLVNQGLCVVARDVFAPTGRQRLAGLLRKEAVGNRELLMPS